MTSVSSAFQQQQQQDNNAYNNSGSSIEDYSTPDVGVSVRDVEAARTKSSALLAAAATRNSNDDTNSHSGVRELMAPMGTSLGNEPLTLAFGNLSVWAPVNPKKPSLFSRAWSKAVSCGKAESNPQRQILFDVTGQVCVLGCWVVSVQWVLGAWEPGSVSKWEVSRRMVRALCPALLSDLSALLTTPALSYPHTTTTTTKTTGAPW